MVKEERNSSYSVFYNKSRKKWNAQIRENNIVVKTKSFETYDEAIEYIKIYKLSENLRETVEKDGVELVPLMKSIALKKLNSNIVQESQYKRILETIKYFENSKLSKIPVKKIREKDIQDFLNSFIASYSDSTIRKIYSELNQAFLHLINIRYIKYNPLMLVIKPKSKKGIKKQRALTTEEELRFVEYLKNVSIDKCRYKNALIFQLYTGLRIGEVLALTKEDIDFDRKIIKVNKTLTVDENSKIISNSQTKTVNSNREIPISNYLMNVINEQIEIANNNKTELLFTNKYGGFVEHRRVNSELKSILKKLNIFGISTHSLRRTFATRCVEGGISDVVLKNIMGHYDIKLTKNIYVDVQNSYKNIEFEKVDKYFENMGF